MVEQCAQLHISGGARTYDVVQSSANFAGITLCVVDGGGNIEITNRETTPKHLVAPVAIANNPDGTPIEYYPPKPLPMNSGIRIIISGGTPTIDAWVFYQTNQ